MIDMKKPTLYLVRGVSGAGKSTFGTILANSVDAYCFEADDYFYTDGVYKFQSRLLAAAHQWCQDMTEQALRWGSSVVVSDTCTTEKEVQVYQEIARSTNSNFVSLIVENRNDTMSIHDVPEGTLKRQRNRFSVKL